MTIRYDMTQKAHINGMTTHIRRTQKKWGIIRKLMILAMFVMMEIPLGIAVWQMRETGVFEWHNQNIAAIVFATVGPLLLAANVAYFRVPKVRARQHSYRQLHAKGNEGYIGPHEIVVDKNGIRITYGETHINVAFSALHGLYMSADEILIYTSPSTLETVPNFAFSGSKQKQEFFEHVKDRIEKAWAEKKTTEAGPQGTLRSLEKEKRDARFVLRFEWTIESLVQALVEGNRLFYKTRLAWTPFNIARVLVGMALVASGVWIYVRNIINYQDTSFWVYLSGSVLAFLGLLINFGLIIAHTPMIRTICKTQIGSGVLPKDFLGPQELLFLEDKLILSRTESSMDFLWGKIVQMKEGGEFCILFCADRKQVIIPKSAFAGEKQRREVYNFVEAHINNH